MKPRIYAHPEWIERLSACLPAADAPMLDGVEVLSTRWIPVTEQWLLHADGTTERMSIEIPDALLEHGGAS